MKQRRLRRLRRAVITGIGIVSPVGTGVKDFWDNLLAGRSGVGRIELFDPSSFPTQIAAQVLDTSYTELLTSREMKYYSRASQFAVAGFRLAAQDAKLQEFDSHRTAVVAGSGISSFDVIERNVHSTRHAMKNYEPIDRLGMTKAFITAPAAAIALASGAAGYVSALSTACTSGLNAVGTAMERIEGGLSDVCIAAAVDAPITKIILSAFCSASYFSTDNENPTTCLRPFDENRTKCLLGEGSAVFIMESARHAMDRGAKIYCTASSFALGTENVNEMFLFDTSGRRWGDVIGRVAGRFRAASRNSHISAHATSDKNADRIEADAIRFGLGTNARKPTISSIKDCVGSGLAAAGGFQVASSACSILYGTVPGTANCSSPGHEFSDLRVLSRPQQKDVQSVLINSHGFGGINAALVLERFLA